MMANKLDMNSRQAYESLQSAIERHASERSIARHRVIWELTVLRERGVVTAFYRARGGGWIVEARGTHGRRHYATVRDLEHFAAGANAALGW